MFSNETKFGLTTLLDLNIKHPWHCMMKYITSFIALNMVLFGLDKEDCRLKKDVDKIKVPMNVGSSLLLLLCLLNSSSTNSLVK